MHRRQFLLTYGAGMAGLAGCLSEQRADGTGTTTDGSPTSMATAVDTSPTPTATAVDTSLTVEFSALQAGFVELNVDVYEMVSDPTSQYLFLNVSVNSGTAPSLSDFRFRFDGDEHPPITPTEDPWVHRQDDEGDSYDAGSEWMLFELPETGDASDAALVWPGGEWQPDEPLRARLGVELPSLSLTEWVVPETVPLDGHSTFEFTAHNESDHAGRFIGAINADGWMPHRPVAIVSRRVPPNGSESWTVGGEEITLVEEALSESVGDGEPDITYELVWTGGDRDRQVGVVARE